MDGNGTMTDLGSISLGIHIQVVITLTLRGVMDTLTGHRFLLPFLEVLNGNGSVKTRDLQKTILSIRRLAVHSWVRSFIVSVQISWMTGPAEQKGYGEKYWQVLSILQEP